MIKGRPKCRGLNVGLPPTSIFYVISNKPLTSAEQLKPVCNYDGGRACHVGIGRVYVDVTLAIGQRSSRLTAHAITVISVITADRH